ncbi:hypothetical protein [Tumebacillus lipolyticus]|uniref:ABC transporter permease n=1 Tax=Tumebacillus lipolyticus TaxID=1280370 RepID=A0ABW4ZWK1_9BACL
MMRMAMRMSLGDARQVVRDPVLLMSMLAPLLMALVIRLGVPFADGLAEERIGISLLGHEPFLISFLLSATPLMLGLLIGFLLLEERDEEMLAYLAITPLGKIGYLCYRLISPVLLSVIFSLIGFLVAGVEAPDALHLWPVLLMLALEAPLLALMMGVFAGNKVEGLALSKAAGVLFVAPVVAYFVTGPWQWAAGVLPTFWAVKAFLASGVGESVYWLYIGVGIPFHALLLVLLVKKLNAKGS